MGEFKDMRRRMVDNQLRTRDITDYRILDAMGTVPRELFVPKAKRPFAYSDRDIEVKAANETGPARYLIAAQVFGKLVQLADIDDTDIVLVVGCASAYATAVLARIANSVVGVEGDEALAHAASETLVEQGIDNAAIVAGDPTKGLASEGPFDVILIEGAVDEIPEALTSQMKDGGRLVCVKGRGGSAEAILATSSDGKVSVRPAFNACVPTLQEFAKAPEFAF
ncbi:protein-L-isoaspartate(D-aspartate) O-methyltransferase [Breoghania corrubedonensis]|uniref:Protein-L-isoaspartate O-methyltransferase n=1 Tax=Breoghania corrubedonensis TaxID=665038 RepID=A0A2T5V9E6_9HYPH|nr:protein-L-isoaspartate O-methyltransferase [Breoghania corrubedonensis]PTW60383.1 protein-L-isoaspartate(D-aspartate) O-methyltransferase [Breoghania corrubedonensis]